MKDKFYVAKHPGRVDPEKIELVHCTLCEKACVDKTFIVCPNGRCDPTTPMDLINRAVDCDQYIPIQIESRHQWDKAVRTLNSFGRLPTTEEFWSALERNRTFRTTLIQDD